MRTALTGLIYYANRIYIVTSFADIPMLPSFLLMLNLNTEDMQDMINDYISSTANTYHRKVISLPLFTPSFVSLIFEFELQILVFHEGTQSM